VTLRAEQLSVHYGGVRAVDDVDLVLERSEILGLIGPNGAGKTTFINAVSGFQRLTRGRVFLDERDVTNRAPKRLAHMGLVRTFQGARIFADLSVFENVELGGLGIGLRRRDARRQAWALLDQMQLSSSASARASTLPYGDERRVAILRALAARPRFLLLDEPAAGLNEVETRELADQVIQVRGQFECGILVIEHDMRFVMGVCDRVHVLDHGKTLAVGSPSEVQANETVIEAYLGTHASQSAD
jgi:branched-chain amino acid transport system ATP-binding protein